GGDAGRNVVDEYVLPGIVGRPASDDHELLGGDVIGKVEADAVAVGPGEVDGARRGRDPERGVAVGDPGRDREDPRPAGDGRLRPGALAVVDEVLVVGVPL